jgi:AraC-like DNA-binding protein
MRCFRVLPSSLPGTVAVEAQTNHVFARHMHEQFGVGVIVAGAQKSLSGRGMVEAEAGDIITVNPGEVHDGAPVGDDGRAWRMLYFDSHLVLGLASEIGEGKDEGDEFSHPVVRDSRFTGRFLAFYRAVTGADPLDTLLRREELLLGLFAPLLRQRAARAEPAVPAAMARLRQRMVEAPATSLTLADLAEESGLSRYQVVRGFSKAFGLPPHAYLLQCRINLARRMIANGTPLAEAALASGFSDQSHMTRIFARSFGVSPGAFGHALR